MKIIASKIGCALVAAGLAQSAQAQWTYAGGNLNTAQTYDGAGVDSALNPRTQGVAANNDYIGNGAAGNGSITVQSGTLTINAGDFKVAQWAGSGAQTVGAITVASGATLNINQIGQWGGWRWPERSGNTDHCQRGNPELADLWLH